MARFEEGERICSGILAWEQLQEGDRWECWLAWSVPLWSPVVVKLPPDHLMDDVRSARRLGREARVRKRLSHPSIRRLLDDAHWQPVPHLLLEHVPGPTLAARLQTGPLPPDEVASVGVQLASCLHYLHEHSLVHLGLRPDGVAISEGRAVLLDLDQARPPGEPAPRTRPASALGYLAPEQRGRQCAGAPMDLFSLGAVLYELATGRCACPPAGCEEEVATAEGLRLASRRPRVAELCPAVPRRLEQAIHTLLEPDLGRRPATAMEALRLLSQALPDAGGRPWPRFADAVLPPVPTPASRPLAYRAAG